MRTKHAAADIDAYLATQSPANRAALRKLRRTILAAAPDADECVSYQMPAFRHGGRLLVAYAGFKHHCSLFPCGSTTSFAEDLARYETSTGTIRFDPKRGLPASLVRRIVKARVAENAAKQRATKETTRARSRKRRT
jgi:uncharacterized protein YdhG (YjbR/CyaY superfamily)